MDAPKTGWKMMNRPPDKEQEWIEKYRAALYDSHPAKAQPAAMLRSVGRALGSLLARLMPSIASSSSAPSVPDPKAGIPHGKPGEKKVRTVPDRRPPALERRKVKRAS